MMMKTIKEDKYIISRTNTHTHPRSRFNLGLGYRHLVEHLGSVSRERLATSGLPSRRSAGSRTNSGGYSVIGGGRKCNQTNHNATGDREES